MQRSARGLIEVGARTTTSTESAGRRLPKVLLVAPSALGVLSVAWKLDGPALWLGSALEAAENAEWEHLPAVAVRRMLEETVQIYPLHGYVLDSAKGSRDSAQLSTIGHRSPEEMSA